MKTIYRGSDSVHQVQLKIANSAIVHTTYDNIVICVVDSRHKAIKFSRETRDGYQAMQVIDDYTLRYTVLSTDMTDLQEGDIHAVGYVESAGALKEIFQGVIFRLVTPNYTLL